MRVLEWLNGLFRRPGMSKAETVPGSRRTALYIEEYAVLCAVNLIARAVSQCEFRTFINHQEVREKDYWQWNFEPNKNQNASLFIQELITRILYRKEALVVESGGQLLIADSFQRQKFALREDVFTQVSRGDFTFYRSFESSEVLYFCLEDIPDCGFYSKGFFDTYDELAGNAAEQYERRSEQKLIINIDSIGKGGMDFEKQYAAIVNEHLAPFFKARKAALPLFDGWSAAPFETHNGRTTSEITDFQAICNQALEHAARLFSIPPALLKGEIADVASLTENLLSFCIDPIASMLEKEINRKLYAYEGFQSGCYLKIDTAGIQHLSPVFCAEKVDKLIASGVYCIDEVRRRFGDVELGTPESQQHFITKNYQGLEGGEETGESKDVGGEAVRTAKNA